MENVKNGIKYCITSNSVPYINNYIIAHNIYNKNIEKHFIVKYLKGQRNSMTYSSVMITICITEGVGFERNEEIRTYGYLFIIKEAKMKKG